MSYAADRRDVRGRAAVSVCVAGFAAFALVLVGSAPAFAAFPGGNGLIAFVSNRGGGEGSLYTMHTNGTGVRLVSPEVSGARDPAWSADGKHIVFTQDGKLSVINPDGSGLHELEPNQSDPIDSPTWSPSGTQIAYEEDDSILVMDSDGTHITTLSDGGSADESGKSDPSWSPSGGLIADVDPEMAGTGGSGSITVFAPGSSRAKVITNGATQDDSDSAPDWSPDGRKIAFQRYVNCTGGTCTNAVWVVNANGTGAHQVQLNAATPAWSPNGKEILFVRKDDGASDIFVMNADGTGVKRLTKNSVSDFNPAWQPA